MAVPSYDFSYFFTPTPFLLIEAPIVLTWFKNFRVQGFRVSRGLEVWGSGFRTPFAPELVTLQLRQQVLNKDPVVLPLLLGSNIGA